ncbi:MAG: AarF/ABC1/UbiB kinase family protein [Armatimonadetes bacterium]|nr:AarF/ABC1/UbiB kinase family protein [Armatimonadota bacterium]
MVFQRQKRHLERYIQIGKILAKHGWASLMVRLGVADFLHIRRYTQGLPPAPVQVRQALEELGPTFIKLGQILSTRPDLLPDSYIAELSKLQDSATPVSLEEIYAVIEEEFGAPVHEIFPQFDDVPLATASLGQTHLAVLPDGTEVVVKVQRPGIRSVIENDLEIIASLVRFIEQHSERARLYNLSDLVDEFSITLRQEMDYTREGRHGDQLKQILANLHFARVARTFWEYTTTRVLTVERVCGVKISDMEELESRGYDKHQIAQNLSRIFLHMVFVDGFFHGDPHPGNIVVQEGNVIGLIDYGMVGRLDRSLRGQVTTLVAEYLQEDSNGFADALLSIGTFPPDLDRKAFVQELDRLLRQYYGAPVGEVRIGEALSRSLGITTRYAVRLPASLGLLVKVLIGIEGIDRMLDPNFNLAEEARPFIAKSIREQFSPSLLTSQLYHTLLSWKELFLELPHRASDVLDRMAEGTFRIAFKHEGLEKPISDIDKSANRLSFALISSATIIASALILSSEIGPMWKGYPVIGVVGFGIAFIFAVWLMLSIIRAGKLW